jgi:CRP-like cAMP-binding protein
MSSTPPLDLKSARVAEFATAELILDLLYTSSTTLKQDLESIWIILCVLHNTRRDVVTDPEAAALHLGAEIMPEEVRHSMSRRAIADKTGLSRETVRRRTNRLIEDEVLEAEPNGNVKLAQNARTASDIKGLNQVHVAVQAYLKRLSEHHVKMPLAPKSKP